MVNLELWESEEGYGAPLGLNLLGIGDGNNDGQFNLFDIDAIAAIIAGDGGDGDGGDSEYVYEVVAWLKAYFGMED